MARQRHLQCEHRQEPTAHRQQTAESQRPEYIKQSTTYLRSNWGGKMTHLFRSTKLESIYSISRHSTGARLSSRNKPKARRDSTIISSLPPPTSSNTGSSAPGTAAGSCPLLPLLEDGAGGGPSDGGTTRKHCTGRETAYTRCGVGRPKREAHSTTEALAQRWQREARKKQGEGGGGQGITRAHRTGAKRGKNPINPAGGKPLQGSPIEHSVSKQTQTDTGVLVEALQRARAFS